MPIREYWERDLQPLRIGRPAVNNLWRNVLYAQLQLSPFRYKYIIIRAKKQNERLKKRLLVP